jgi:hypothetical protein
VSRTSLAIEHTRVGEIDAAFVTFGISLRGYVRHGNFTHAVTAMRHLVGLLARVGDDRAAALLAGAISKESLRVSYGLEAEQIAAVVAGIERRVGNEQFTAWFGEGQACDPDAAVRLAAELVAVHLG